VAPKELELPELITVGDLAGLIDVSPIDVIKNLMRNGVMATVNQPVSYDVATLVAGVFGVKTHREQQAQDAASATPVEEEDASKLLPRPPVVTMLGHVDHGKTTLLDAIRQTRVAEGEVGGITQHIGAYQITVKGQRITFLDTPGHEAFTAMRARGARLTDIAILVVAADDGVMPQTVEALDHAKAAEVPIIVAINKIDRPESDVDRVKRQLGEQGLVLEEWGGDVVTVPVSALQKTGIDDLLENILVVAELAEFKANPDRPASGAVAEARLDQSRGPVCTVLVQNGTLEIGDNVVAGATWGRVKALFSESGKRLRKAGPSTPVELLGLAATPEAGDLFHVEAAERAARTIAEERARSQTDERIGRTGLGLEGVYTRISSGEVKELNLIAKADVQGSVEAIRSALEKRSTESTRIRFIHMGSGNVTESDVLLAAASEAIIIGFNVRSEAGAEPLAGRNGVQIRHYSVIYRVVEDVEKALAGLLEPEYREVVDGRAEVRAVFSVGRGGQVAGCMVTEGRIARNALVRVYRAGELVHEGNITGVRRFKDDVNEVSTGFECGIRIGGFSDVQENDIIEAYSRQRV
jgi:translation initiation factor IF-2